MRRPPRQSAAFTILEVLLALFVLATAVVLLGEGYTQNLRAIGDNRLQTTLAFLAQWKMSEVAAGAISPDLDAEGSFEEEGYPGFDWRIEQVETETPGLTEVTVTTRRLDAEGSVEGEFSLVRLIYRPTGSGEEGLLP